MTFHPFKVKHIMLERKMSEKGQQLYFRKRPLIILRDQRQVIRKGKSWSF